MKRLIPYITPIVLAAFINAITPSVARAEATPKPSGNITINIAHATDVYGQWTNTPLDLNLANAVWNDKTQAWELQVEIDLGLPATDEIQKSMEKSMFFKSDANIISSKYLGFVELAPKIYTGIHPMITMGCNVGVFIVIIVVGGVIIYCLYKTCKRLLPENPPPA